MSDSLFLVIPGRFPATHDIFAGARLLRAQHPVARTPAVQNGFDHFRSEHDDCELIVFRHDLLRHDGQNELYHTSISGFLSAPCATIRSSPASPTIRLGPA